MNRCRFPMASSVCGYVDPQALPADLEQELRRRLLPGSLEPPIDGEATPVDDGTDLL